MFLNIFEFCVGPKQSASPRLFPRERNLQLWNLDESLNPKMCKQGVPSTPQHTDCHPCSILLYTSHIKEKGETAKPKGKKEKVGARFRVRTALGNQTARTHLRTNEAKRFPGWTPPTSGHSTRRLYTCVFSITGLLLATLENVAFD